jgi:hypothetical protein
MGIKENKTIYQDASKAISSTPLCNIGLNLNVKGNGTFAEIQNINNHVNN